MKFIPVNVVCRRRVNRAFTLVELLVVVAIIFALAALLLPALGTAREFGRRARCLSNMHQISLAMNIYADENNGQLPPYLYQVEENNSNGTPTYNLVIKIKWSMANVGPLSNPNILLCPSDKNPSTISTTDPSGKPITILCSYGYNFEMFMQGVGAYHLRSEKVALLFDGEPDQATSGAWAGSPGSSYASAGSATASLAGQGGGKLQCPADTDGMTWVCHAPPGNPSQTHCEYVGVTASGPQGHSNHPGDYCGPCTDGCDPYRFNNQLLDRRHFNMANIIYLDGHGEFASYLSGESVEP